MGLIDTDTLIPLIQKDKIEGKSLDIIKALGDGLQAETLNQACDRHIKIINSLPIIEAKPVKHGRWIKLYHGNYKCSECGDWWGSDDNNEVISDFIYCPHCGAKMDLTE